MITFSQLGRYGAIGNQLFQYATLYSIGKINSYEVKIPKTEEHFDEGTSRIQHYFLNCFDDISVDILKDEDLIDIKYNIHWPNMIFNENILKIPDHSNLQGYFQSFKYFDQYKIDLLKQFNFKQSVKQKIYNKYDIDYSKYSSIHLRCGDYFHRQHIHPVMDFEYYSQALNFLNTENYLVFSDTIEKAKETFSKIKNINFIYIDGNHAFEDLFLMSLCKNNIIANSSFSWWGAYLNKNNPKIVGPANWFGKGYREPWNINDIIPKEWKTI